MGATQKRKLLILLTKRFQENQFHLNVVRQYATQPEVDDALRTGRVDVVLSSRPVLEHSLLGGPGGEAFALVGDEIRHPTLLGEGAGIVVRKEDTDLVTVLNRAIAAVRADGTYDHIRRKYFSYDIYGE